MVGLDSLVYRFTCNEKTPNVPTKLRKCIIDVASFLVFGEGAKSPQSTNRTKIKFHYMILITLFIAIMVIYYRYHYLLSF